MKCAVFPCLGLGDGLIALILSHNLKQNGHEVDTFHPFMSQMQPLFPELPILPRPQDPASLQNYDRIFFIYEKLDWMQSFIKEALVHHREKTTILNPIATPNQDYPYWEEGRFDGTKPFVHNLVTYCTEQLQLENPTKDNGFILPPHIESKKYPKRVILHPTSSRPGKNWPAPKFLKLANRLSTAGYEPVFILTEKEKADWPQIGAPHFENLETLTHFIAESGSMIGNDSGIGHLASLVGLPTLTICRSKLSAPFWRPAWTPGVVLTPPPFIPNLKGLRLRDKKWQAFIPVRTVYSAFHSLVGRNYDRFSSLKRFYLLFLDR